MDGAKPTHNLWGLKRSAVNLTEATRRLLAAYPKVFFACHQRHRKDARTRTTISAHQGQILDHVDERGGTPLGLLARHLGVTPSTMSLNVDKLVALGAVNRVGDPDDRRRVQVVLTTLGLRLRRAASILDPQRVTALLRRLPAAQREQALLGLELLAAAGGGQHGPRVHSRKDRS